MAYTYLIGWSKLEKFYYGARWAKECTPDDLWVTYFTSSKHVKEFRKIHGEPDIIQIRDVFDDVNECRKYEERVLRKLRVTVNEKWLNRGYNGMYLPTGKRTTEHQNKIIAALTGKKKKPWSEEHKRMLSEKTKGISKTFSEEHKAALKYHDNNSTTVECPHCSAVGQLTNMKHWHFDNCPTVKPRPVYTCPHCGINCKSKGSYTRSHGDNCKLIPK